MILRKSLLAAAAAAAIGLSALASPVLAENPMVGGSEMFPEKNIIENAVNSKDHTTLVAAVKAAGLVDTLSGEGPFTVFAPTNDAFAKLPAGTVDSLLKPENKDKLTKVLTYHVVAANAMSDDINKMVKDDGGKHKVKTVSGDTLPQDIEKEYEADAGTNTRDDELLASGLGPGKYNVSVFIHVQYRKPDGGAMILNDNAGSVHIER